MYSLLSVLRLAQQATSTGAATSPTGQATTGQATTGSSGGGLLGGGQGGQWWQTLIFFGVMILIFWLLIIRPQQKQRKKQEEFLTSLKNGDKIVTAAGLIGRIVTITGDVITLELAKDVRVRIVKNQVVSHFTETAEADKPEEK